MFRNFQAFSFWLGFLVATFFWFILGRFAPILKELWKTIVEQVKNLRDSAQAGVDYHFRNDMIARSQKMHIAAPLFALNEILIPPRIMATPPTPTVEGEIEEKILDDITMSTIPYMPEWPELSAAFNAPTYSLAEAAGKGTSLLLIGHSGSGKTVALAHLTEQIAKKTTGRSELNNRLPVLLHIGDIPAAELAANQPVNAILAALSPYLSARTTPKFKPHLENALAQGLVILLVDGMDELDRDEFLRAAGFLESVVNFYPKTQIIATASPFYTDGLGHLGLVPVAMAAWTPQQHAAFIQNWGEKWGQHIQPTLWSTTPPPKGVAPPLQMEMAILNNWLIIENLATLPLDLTLKVWAAYAGDARGPLNVHALEAYTRRMTTGVRNAETGLERIALQISLTKNPYPSQRSASRWARGIKMEDAEESIIPSAEKDEKEAIEDSAIIEGSVSRQAIPSLIANGILINKADTRVSFVHPTVGGYLAGKALAASGGSSWVQSQPDWLGKQQALRHLAYFGTPLGTTSSFANPNEDVIRQHLLFAARWLPESLSHPKATWRIGLMRDLFTLIGSSGLAIGLRARALTALLLSRDPGIPQMCKRFLQHEDPDVRQVAALGLGFLQDTKAINELGELLYDSDLNVQRAACLALVAIGNQAALEAVATALLHGDENQQRAASEALANHVEEGHPVLKEASTFEDLLARRASIYGLARIQETWAREVIDTIRAQDKEWIVRNAAEEVAKQLDKGLPYIPGPLPPLHENGWLLLYAARFGEGIGPGKDAEEMLQRALAGGNDSERLAAMHQLKYASADTGDSAIATLYGTFLQEHDEIQEAAYLALWYLALAGHNLPSPMKFGIGTHNR
ncbi:MAG: HEAT repeat domain-containing protein [Anaerolineales bacterium]|nr:HEAT repeat domain-containing protein [Anaerolineales bacterium]